MENVSNSINTGIRMEAFLSTLFYAFIGISIMLLALIFINMVFRLNMRHELVKENNVAYGVLIGGVSIAIAIIVAGTILS